jgi:hypothetical protein
MPMSTRGPDFFGPYDEPPQLYGTTPGTGGEVKFGAHEPWNVFCPCEKCVIPRLAFQRWRFQRGLLTEDLTRDERKWK